MNGWTRIRLLPLIVAAVAAPAAADDTWSGNGDTSFWSEGTNWADGTAPSNDAGGVITFNNTDVGTSNVADGNWTLTALKYENTTPGAAHTTVVADTAVLLIRGGSLTVGEARTNTLAAILGGTVQLGDEGSPADLRVGVAAGSSYTGACLTVASSLNLASVNAFYVGRQTGMGAGNSVSGALDARASAISCGASSNVLKAREFVLGGGGGRHPSGWLTLPPDLAEIEVGKLELATGTGGYPGTATLDLGTNSRLRRLTVTNDFSWGRAGKLEVTGWPADVDVTVGAPGAPVAMAVGCSEGGSGGTNCGASLTLSNGSFVARLTTLWVGRSTGIGSGAGVDKALLDLAGTTVQIGDEPNKVGLTELNVGGGGGRLPEGILRLPASVTDIAVGKLELGAAAGGSGYTGDATLDLGAGSQLRTLTVTNACTIGSNARTDILNWPSGVDVTVGLSNAPVAMIIGCAPGSSTARAGLTLTNGSFAACLTSLRIGADDATAGSATGVLDLSQAGAVRIGPEPSKVALGELSVGWGAGDGSTMKGTLRFPPFVTDISVGRLQLGHGYAGAPGSETTFDLGAGSQLRTLTVSNAFLLGTGARVALLNWPAGVTVTVGSASAPAEMVVGGTAGLAAGAALALTNGCFSGYLTTLKVGYNRYTTMGATTGVLDLAHTTLSALDIRDSMLVGAWLTTPCATGKGYVYLPAGDANCASNLYVGDTDTTSRGVLELNGTRFTVGRRVEINVTGRVTNHVNGAASGIDFAGATNDFVIAAGGRMHVAFDQPPADRSRPYWGLKMKGDVRDFLGGLTNDVSRFTFDTAGLSPEDRSHLGIYYRPGGDYTYLGIEPVPRGTVIMAH